jgi:hypothetical protein
VDDIEGGYEYPPEVRFQFSEQDLDSYRRAADFLNFSNVDVNARALVLTVLLEDLGKDSRALHRAASTYAAFINYAFSPESGRFRNFMSFDRHWMEQD